ncbi:septum site-determining protein MinC [Endozoicomonas montiporae]|uniref:Probable septum site-determining protein MinC n=1 Tax=Endozoicomonas montiporae CL-33 TaxID=570277 RepID=A0A142BAS9_9GAMM|nr:septum site-determining protein MinC [Endozoicomonas montiporae]AMO55855.1 putative septum site-determining protein MinC [Endozoicomonas montiporae CL-33]
MDIAVMASVVNSKSPPAFQLKGSLYTLTTLELHTTSHRRLKQQLEGMTSKAPHFFHQTPVVLDLDKLSDDSEDLNLVSIRHLLHHTGMILVALRGGTEHHKKTAQLAGVAWLPHQKQKRHSNPQNSNVVMLSQPDAKIPVEKNRQEPVRPEATIISRPVRSGQQLYSEGDLIVLGQVSEGAELLAGGHIHIYGSFRGRALAGVNGDKKARIFCNQFEAELVSISGQYKLTSQDQSSVWSHRWGQNAQIFLDNDHLHITALS